MRVFVCKDHEGLWPVPTASVVVAENEEQAFRMLREELKNEHGIDDDSFTLKEINTGEKSVTVLSNGDY